MPTYERQIAGLQRKLDDYEERFPRSEWKRPIPPRPDILTGILKRLKETYTHLYDLPDERIDEERRLALLQDCHTINNRITSEPLAPNREPTRFGVVYYHCSLGE